MNAIKTIASCACCIRIVAIIYSKIGQKLGSASSLGWPFKWALEQRLKLPPKLWHLDARWFQIIFLASFLILGAWARDFALSATQVLFTFSSALLTQAAWQWGLNLPNKKHWGGYLSAIISSFGICILVRSDNSWAFAWVHPVLACVAMSSKYLVRAGPPESKSHLLNPANLAAFAAIAWVPGAWLSPGQWGSGSLAALWFLALGGLVTQRISRWDVSLSFLAAWAGVLALRLWLLGYAWNPGAAMWLQQISNGAVLLFAFFMISDPMTTPQRRTARIAYAVAVALLAFGWQFVLFKPHGLIVVLFLMSWTVPVWNHLWPQRRFEWKTLNTPKITIKSA
jgi:enediyne biosynthesis protein E5